MTHEEKWLGLSIPDKVNWYYSKIEALYYYSTSEKDYSTEFKENCRMLLKKIKTNTSIDHHHYKVARDLSPKDKSYYNVIFEIHACFMPNLNSKPESWHQKLGCASSDLTYFYKDLISK